MMLTPKQFCQTPFLVLFFYTSLNSQIANNYGEITDDRDGTTYQTIEIGTTLWIAENMKYETANSEEHELDVEGVPYDGYFYPHDEVSETCPAGFRIPNSTDWKAYMEYLLQLRNIPSTELEYTSTNKRGREGFGASYYKKGVKPFDEPNPLRLKPQGHTQAGKMVAFGSYNIWMKHEDSTDPKFHLHIDNDGYGIHTHKNHITKKLRKLRKFSVRCVMDVTD